MPRRERATRHRAARFAHVPHRTGRRRQLLSERTFTVEQANRMLPLVRAIVRDILEQEQQVAELEERLAPLADEDMFEGLPQLHCEEIKDLMDELQRARARLRELILELESLGVEYKGGEGLVDFPAIFNGKPVYLCWKYGEPEIEYWHELQAGFAGRKPLTSGIGRGSKKEGLVER